MESYFAPEALQLKQAQGIIEGFINSCSHKLKSPLSSIEGLLNLAQQCSTAKEVNRYLNLIHDCTKNMLEMVSRLEQYITIQNRELVRETVSPETIVEDMLSSFQDNIDDKRITIITNITSSSPWKIDPACISLILESLIDNSILYSDDSKEIKKIVVDLSVTKDLAALAVSDNGIGIPFEEQKKIFEPFHRSAIQSTGNGLGLFVAKGVIDKLKGNISVHSKEAVGTSTLITIPNNPIS